MPQGQYPALVAGGVFTADLVQSFSPYTAWKTSDTARSSSTTGPDPDLTLAVAANASYTFKCVLSYEGGPNGSSDLTWFWGVPGTGTLRYHLVCVNNVSGGQPNVGSMHTGSDSPTAGTSGSGTLMGLSMAGTLFTATAGQLQLNWTQNTSNATQTVIHAQSYLQLQRFA